MKALGVSLVFGLIILLGFAALLEAAQSNWLLMAVFGVPALVLFVGGQYVLGSKQ